MRLFSVRELITINQTLNNRSQRLEKIALTNLLLQTVLVFLQNFQCGITILFLLPFYLLVP